MNRNLTTILLVALLLLFLLAPFAGLAPLMLLLLVAGVIWGVGSLLQVLVFGEEDRESERS